jgi:TRAP-type uncharacterized transport system fused permease subunit
MFVYVPALLMIGTWQDIAIASATAGVGCILMAAGLHGYLLRAAVMWERAVLLAAALLLVNPYWLTDLIGFGLGAAMLLRHRFTPAPAAAG